MLPLFFETCRRCQGSHHTIWVVFGLLLPGIKTEPPASGNSPDLQEPEVPPFGLRPKDWSHRLFIRSFDEPECACAGRRSTACMETARTGVRLPFGWLPR